MDAASGYQEIFDKTGRLIKIKAFFGRSKEVCINVYNGHTYLHLSDKSKCYNNGQFDITKSKSVSLKWEEVATLRTLVH